MVEVVNSKCSKEAKKDGHLEMPKDELPTPWKLLQVKCKI